MLLNLDVVNDEGLGHIKDSAAGYFDDAMSGFGSDFDLDWARASFL